MKKILKYRPVSFRFAETAQENIDEVIKRAYEEIGAEGERIDSDDYQTAWGGRFRNMRKPSRLVKKKSKEGQELSNDESQVLADRLNSPKFCFNEANLREAYRYQSGR